MKDFRSKKGIWILLAAVLLAAGIFALSHYTEGRAGPVANAVNFLVAPVRNGMSSLANWVEEKALYFQSVDELSAENEALKQQVAELEEQARTGAAAARENERLRDLLELREQRRELQYESAIVVSRSSSNWEATITLSKGSNHDIEIGNCVVDQYNQLVGVVTDCGTNWSTVSLVIDSSIEMGGKLARTDATAILEGDFSLMTQGTLKLSYLPEDADLLAGDTVVTSGRGGVYPSDLVVGYVERVYTESDGVSRYAVVQPASAFDELYQVFVITSFEINE